MLQIVYVVRRHAIYETLRYSLNVLEFFPGYTVVRFLIATRHLNPIQK